MRLPPYRPAGIGLAVIVMAGCFGGPAASTSTPAATASATPSSTPAGATPTAAPSAAPTAEPVAPDEVGAFSCELPVVEDATVARAQIVDVRAGSHDDYDRVVFEFSEGLPEFTLDRAEPPFTQDASGLPIEVEGTSFLRVVMRGGTKQTEEGTSSYDGPTDFDPGFPMLVDVVEGGDFEAQSTWYLGLNGPACVRVMRLVGEGGSPRLVIDLEAVPSADLGPFDCDDPTVADTAPARAQLADVRVGTHADYDRVVFEFSNALPQISIERAEPPFRHDVTGAPIAVHGSSFLRLSLAGGTKETEDHTSSYDGPIDFDPEFPTLVDLVEGGDFEAHSTWYLGLSEPACSRVTLLTTDGSHRIVIDVES
jgi:hypothetical protein